MCLAWLTGAEWHLGKEVVFLQMEWFLNHETRASEEDTLSTPPSPTWSKGTETVPNLAHLQDFVSNHNVIFLPLQIHLQVRFA